MDASPKNEVPKPDVFFVDHGMCTHIGQRQHNQDNTLAATAPDTLDGTGHLFAVADGMGGHPGGGLASRLACEGLNHYYKKEFQPDVNRTQADIRRRLAEAIIRFDRSIRIQGLRHSFLEDMGTTLSCLVLTDTHSVIAHVGDSRIYRLRKGHLSCLTVDHTFVQDMIFEGEVNPAQAHLHPLRHMLTRAVGTGEPLEFVDARVDDLKADDCFLLCTDGLYNAVDENWIIDSLANRPFAEDSATELINKALKGGARDNVTAVVVKFHRVDDLCQNVKP
ncbi:Protein serine/threonine phosphatase PrpC, regulation of stationary phase [Olavius algarvensis associated proteobacterium Delta 3]|nr:Protein serine/threonine phosphatase PrpC, regulation of stationary phase [Olavius algarvensis associated proteobacterium Delta 3]CAB5149884.1 Protein serine/threonine phosphatase PrpC, regulation of stationary phase [Olavius algarvensis associated proteobacterium Delta 3]